MMEVSGAGRHINRGSTPDLFPVRRCIPSEAGAHSVMQGQWICWRTLYPNPGENKKMANLTVVVTDLAASHHSPICYVESAVYL